MTDLLRRAYLAAKGPEGGHVTDEEWERLATGELGTGERERVLDHVTRCDECRAIYRAVAMVAAEAHTFDPGAPESGRFEELRPGRRSPTRWAAAALALAAVVGLALVLRPLLHPSSPVSPVVRSGGVHGAPVPLAPKGSTEGRPIVFRWEPVEGARGYGVELLDGNGEPVWTGAETAATELTLPGAIRLAPGPYYWRVVAVTPQGRRLPSELVAITVAASRRPSR